jgi:hypothetical protein
MKKYLIGVVAFMAFLGANTAVFAQNTNQTAPNSSPVASVAASVAPSASPVATPTASEVCRSFVGDKLQTALIDVVNKTVQVAGDAKDFVIAQLPDVIKQLLLWKFAESFAPMAFWFLVAFISTSIFFGTTIKHGDWLAATLTNGRSSDRPKNGFPRMFTGIFKAIVSLVGIIMFLCSLNMTWLQIWLAPKVYLIEYVRNMVK